MAIINEEELNRELQRLSIYKKEEEINLNDLKIKIRNINDLYKTDNTNKLNNLNLELSNKYKIISNIHNNYSIIVERTITKYKETSAETAKEFSNIVGDNQ